MEIAERRASPSPSTDTGPMGPLMLAMSNLETTGLGRTVPKGFAKNMGDKGETDEGVDIPGMLFDRGSTTIRSGFFVDEDNASGVDGTPSISLYGWRMFIPLNGHLSQLSVI